MMEKKIRSYIMDLIDERCPPEDIPAKVKEKLIETGQYTSSETTEQFMFSSLVKGMDETRRIDAVLLNIRKIEFWRRYYRDFEKGEPVFQSEEGIPYAELERNYQEIYTERIIFARCNIAEYCHDISKALWQAMIEPEYGNEYEYDEVISNRFMFRPYFEE